MSPTTPRWPRSGSRARFESAEDGIGAGISADNIRRSGLDEDIAWCARENALDLVPQIVARAARSVEIAA